MDNVMMAGTVVEEVEPKWDEGACAVFDLWSIPGGARISCVSVTGYVKNLPQKGQRIKLYGPSLPNLIGPFRFTEWEPFEE